MELLRGNDVGLVCRYSFPELWRAFDQGLKMFRSAFSFATAHPLNITSGALYHKRNDAEVVPDLTFDA